MDILATVIKYIFVVALGIEGLLILRAVVRLAREKAGTDALQPAPGEE